ncbi:hypothetical protein ADL26_19605, partial [Thermoactinomyces vulgaris]
LEDQILELIGHPDWPTEKLTAKIRDIASQRAAIDAQLAETGRPRLDQAAELIAPFLEMLADPRRLYESLAEDDRQTLNAICFTRLHVDTDADQRATIAQSAATGSI